MASWRHLGVWVVAAACAAACLAQTAPAANSQSPPAPLPAPCSVAPQPEPCGAKPASGKQPSAAEKFPFPGSGSQSGAAGADSATPNLSGVPQAPDASGTPSAPATKPDAGKDFPFPGEASKPDVSKQFPFPGETSKPAAGASAPGTSSSSSSGDDSTPPADSDATPALQDKGSEGETATPGRHILHRVNPIGTKLQSTDEREAEDLDVAQTYIGMGDLQGAYMRTQDAVKIAPDDPDAHFALAEIALKLQKRDEAIAEYNACLKLDPPDKEAKDARKALARLKP